MQKLEFVGKIISIQPVKQVSETFRKKTFILEIVENYVKDNEPKQYVYNLKFYAVKDEHISFIETIATGSKVKVVAVPKGSKLFTNREGFEDCIVSLNVFALERADATLSGAEQAAPQQPQQPKEHVDDGLPF